MEKTNQNFSDYLEEENKHNSAYSESESSLATTNEPVAKSDVVDENNIESNNSITPGFQEVVAEKLDQNDPYVQILKESIPSDSATRRRVAYSILRSMLLNKKGPR